MWVRSTLRARHIAAASVAAGASWRLLQDDNVVFAKGDRTGDYANKPIDPHNIDFASSKKKWPEFKRDDVAKHDGSDGKVWVTYKNGVFDITSFIENHPGGNKILLAKGKAIDPFWRIYQQHLNSSLPLQLLKKMQVGILDPSEPTVVVDESDPYAKDPVRHPALIVHSTKPMNAEIPQEMMLDEWITPRSLFFIRHHHPVPQVKVENYQLSLAGKGVKPILLSLNDLRTHFPKKEVVATLQCGGNRRHGMNVVKKTSGIDWGFGAISTAKWGGVPLRDVLLYAGLLTPDVADAQGVKHVQFEAIDGLQASIPIEKALSTYGDVLLAYEMNGEALPSEHGYPVRLVVPGHVGVRNVKWLKKITVSGEEAEGPWQRGIAYKGFSPSVTKIDDSVDVENVLSVQEQPVTSLLISPMANETVEVTRPSELEEGQKNEITVRGFAWSGGGRGIVRVDVSSDGGRTWREAELGDGADQHPSRAWAWTFFECDIPVELPEDVQTGDSITLLCKATDASYNSQPERAEPIWNLRGINNNSWHHVQVELKVEEDEDEDD